MKKLISLSLLLLATIGLFVAATPTIEQDGLEIGDQAPNFSLKNIDGKMVSLDDYKDVKGYVVIFTCNTCPYAVMYEQRIIELHDKYAAKGYPVIAINPNDPEVKPGDSYEKMKQRAANKSFPFAYLFDEGQKVYPAYGATRTPHIYLLDAEKTVQYIGALDNNAQDASAVTTKYVEDAIAALEKGEKPEVTTTKAIGCGIKTKRS
ncbi:MAG: thioredoxin family protein [Bacteroidota bacterium]